MSHFKSTTGKALSTSQLTIAYRAICFEDLLCMLHNAEVKMDFNNA